MANQGLPRLNRSTMSKERAKDVAHQLSKTLRTAGITGWIRSAEAGLLIGELGGNVTRAATAYGSIFDTRVMYEKTDVLFVKLKPVSGGDVLPEHSEETLDRVARQAKAFVTGSMVF